MALASEHIQRQVAVVIVVGVELGLFLLSVQGNVRGVDVQYQFLRTGSLAGNELLNQYPVQGHDIRPRGPLLQPAQGRTAAQFIMRAYGRLHQWVVAQGGVVVQVLIAAAQGIQALCDQIAHSMRDAILIPWVVQGFPYRPRQSNAPVDLPQ
jgi:hypothetical protein